MKQTIYCIIFFFCTLGSCFAQRIITGHVYGGLNQNSPVDSMQVRTAYGIVCYTDHSGHYMINTKPSLDTLFFSYKGKQIIHYPASFLPATNKFDVYLQNPGFYDTTYYNPLEDVKVTARNYHTDSLADREMYRGIFDYKKPKINPFSPITTVSNLFNNKYYNRQKRYKAFAISNEQSGYVDSRFTRSYVAKIAGIEDDSILDDFMKEYRPSYAQLVEMGDLDLGMYILDNYKKYKFAHNIK